MIPSCILSTPTAEKEEIKGGEGGAIGRGVRGWKYMEEKRAFEEEGKIKNNRGRGK